MNLLLKFQIVLSSFFHGNRMIKKWQSKIILTIPASIYWEDNRLMDRKVPSSLIELDKTGIIIVEKIMAVKKMSWLDLKTEFTATFPNVAVSQIEKDLHDFILSINSLGYLNIKLKSHNPFTIVLWSFIRLVQGYRSRFELDNKGIILFFSVFIAVIETYLLFLTMSLVASFCLIAVTIFYQVKTTFAIYYLVVVAALFLSIAFHETMHIIVFRKLTGSNQGYLYAKRLSIGIFRSIVPLKKMIFIRLSGPGLTSILGLIMFFSFSNDIIKMMSFIFILHIINLLPFFGDGYKLISDVLNRNSLYK